MKLTRASIRIGVTAKRIGTLAFVLSFIILFLVFGAERVPVLSPRPLDNLPIRDLWFTPGQELLALYGEKHQANLKSWKFSADGGVIKEKSYNLSAFVGAGSGLHLANEAREGEVSLPFAVSEDGSLLAWVKDRELWVSPIRGLRQGGGQKFPLDQSYEVQSIVFVENRIVAVIYRNGKKAFLRALAYDSLRKESSHWLDVGRNFDVPLEIWPHGKYPVFTCFECYKASSLGFDREGIADIYITTQVNRILDGSTAAATPNGSLVAGTKRGFILFLLRQGFVGSQQLDAGPVHAIAALDEARAFGVGREGIYYAYVSPGLSQILPWSKGTVKSVKLGYSVESDKTGGPDQRRLLAASENFLAYGTSERLDFGVLSWAWQFTTAGIFYITLISAVFSLVGLFVGSIFDKRAVG